MPKFELMQAGQGSEGAGVVESPPGVGVLCPDNLQRYLAEVRRLPVLSKEEARVCAERFYHDRDLAAAHRLVTGNLRFVVKIAAEYRHYGLAMLDLIQEGNIGLMHAVRKFDPYRGVAFISYAVWWVRYYIQNYILGAWSLVKIGTTALQKKLFYGLTAARQRVLELTGVDDLAAAADLLGVPELEARAMAERLRRDQSLHEPVTNDCEVSAIELLCDERPSAEAQLLGVEAATRRQVAVSEVVAGLDARDRAIVEARLMADTPKLHRELAEQFGVSRERIRQKEAALQTKLRQQLLPLAREQGFA